MNEIESRLAALGTGIPEILLPRHGTEGSGIDLSKWAVIACDQFTQDLNYWEQVEKTVNGAPSCLNLVFPEVYLEAAQRDKGREDTGQKRIQNIRSSMESYIKEGIFDPPRRCCMYLERSTLLHPKRRGLMLLVDLEQYNWEGESRFLIRSTEGTIRERLPPRMEIRRGAPLELPHILLLIDDEEDSLIPSLGAIAQKHQPLYETSLMMNSGAVAGWTLETEEAWTVLADGLEALAGKSTTRYGGGSPSGGSSPSGGRPFLYAVGDGNHSLATAKAIWEEYKKNHIGEVSAEISARSHPARWALVEVENLYDPGINFEPIHRVVFGKEKPEQLVSDICRELSSLKEIKCIPDTKNSRILRMENLSHNIATASLQPLLDNFVKQKGYSIDYIHGEDEVFRLVSDSVQPAAGLILPPVQKEGLFKTVAATGPLPRKSFSMGEAEEKRFYLECRRLFG